MGAGNLVNLLHSRDSYMKDMAIRCSMGEPPARGESRDG
jgi:hypothetical protein